MRKSTTSNRIILLLIAITGLPICFSASSGCKTTPVTGRRQLQLIPASKEASLGAASYQEILQDQPLSTNQAYIELVNRVGQRIAKEANRPDFEWEFKVIASPEKNAFCLPGGKVAFYEGIIPICENEAGLAVVMSHEIAHALARHGSERMSHGYVVNGVGAVVNRLTLQQEQDTRERVMKAYGLASQYGFVLPYSRKHESEADHIGVMLMAQAGYDPQEAPRFWRRFADSNTGPKQPEFLSTHPADERRAKELEALVPEAMELYLTARHRVGLGVAIAGPTTSNDETPTNRAMLASKKSDLD